MAILPAYIKRMSEVCSLTRVPRRPPVGATGHGRRDADVGPAAPGRGRRCRRGRGPVRRRRRGRRPDSQLLLQEVRHDDGGAIPVCGVGVCDAGGTAECGAEPPPDVRLHGVATRGAPAAAALASLGPPVQLAEGGVGGGGALARRRGRSGLLERETKTVQVGADGSFIRT